MENVIPPDYVMFCSCRLCGALASNFSDIGARSPVQPQRLEACTSNMRGIVAVVLLGLCAGMLAAGVRGSLVVLRYACVVHESFALPIGSVECS